MGGAIYEKALTGDYGGLAATKGNSVNSSDHMFALQQVDFPELFAAEFLDIAASSERNKIETGPNLTVGRCSLGVRLLRAIVMIAIVQKV